MGIGDPASPVESDVEMNNPTQLTVKDKQDQIRTDVDTLAKSGNAEVVRQIRWLYDNLPGGPYPYPPP